MANGNYAYVRDRAYVLRGRDGKPRRLIGSLLDITQQKELDRAKDEFLSLSSHQLRTPLTIVHVLSEMLAGGVAGELAAEQRDYALQISRTCMRMVRMVSDMLSISRMELNRLPIQPIPTDVNELIANHIGEVAGAAAEKSVTIHFAHKHLPRLAIDPVVFGHIIENLLTNAVRYTRAGEGEVRVSFGQATDGYHLVVADNGIGIPQSAQEHVFERFFRAENAASADTSGTGLGLYLVKILTDAFGGSVRVASQEGKGTTVTVHIPAAGMVTKSE
jgi:signal transduction histidine kinase